MLGVYEGDKTIETSSCLVEVSNGIYQLCIEWSSSLDKKVLKFQIEHTRVHRLAPPTPAHA